MPYSDLFVDARILGISITAECRFPYADMRVLVVVVVKGGDWGGGYLILLMLQNACFKWWLHAIFLV